MRIATAATLCLLLAGAVLGPPGCKSSEVKEGGAPAAGSAGAWSQGKVAIIYNNDVFGYLEPCGCTSRPRPRAAREQWRDEE